MLHGELLLEVSTCHECRDAAASERHNGIDDDLSLCPGSWCCSTEVEGRPVHPKEESTDEGKYIGEVVGGWLGVRL